MPNDSLFSSEEGRGSLREGGSRSRMCPCGRSVGSCHHVRVSPVKARTSRAPSPSKNGGKSRQQHGDAILDAALTAKPTGWDGRIKRAKEPES